LLGAEARVFVIAVAAHRDAADAARATGEQRGLPAIQPVMVERQLEAGRRVVDDLGQAVDVAVAITFLRLTF